MLIAISLAAEIHCSVFLVLHFHTSANYPQKYKFTYGEPTHSLCYFLAFVHFLSDLWIWQQWSSSTIKYSVAISGLCFLCGELPIEAGLLIDLLKLFYNVWSNKETKVLDIVLYLMKISKENSTIWSNHIRLVCKLYDLPDPLRLLQQQWQNSSGEPLLKQK